ncbi:MAG: Smr/MutS family protein [Gallionella sp.]
MTVKKPSEHDAAALFQAAVADVTKLPAHTRITHKKPPKFAAFSMPKHSASIADTLSDFDTGVVPDEFLRNGIARLTLRKVRKLPIQDSLDLHGLTSDAARVLLQEFLYHANAQNFRCVLVIHGKGMNSQAGIAVLKIRTRHWLTQHEAVLAYCDAPENQGGAGAVLVLLRN